ncbi:MAG: 2Fe-2S iron-sulfur cluster-binding protein [Acidobacteriota bacterium]
MVLRTPDGAEHEMEVGPDEYVLEAALRNGLKLPYSCLQGWCLSCAARLLEGVMDQQDSTRYYSEDREEGFALLCTGRAKSDLRLKTHARDEMRRARKRRGLPYPRGSWGPDPKN